MRCQTSAAWLQYHPMFRGAILKELDVKKGPRCLCREPMTYSERRAIPNRKAMLWHTERHCNARSNAFIKGRCRPDSKKRAILERETDALIYTGNNAPYWKSIPNSGKGPMALRKGRERYEKTMLVSKKRARCLDLGMNTLLMKERKWIGRVESTIFFFLDSQPSGQQSGYSCQRYISSQNYPVQNYPFFCQDWLINRVATKRVKRKKKSAFLPEKRTAICYRFFAVWTE